MEFKAMLPHITSIRHSHTVHYEDKRSLEEVREINKIWNKIVNTLCCRDSQPPAQAQQEREGDCDDKSLLEVGFHPLGDHLILLLSK